nr:uncharacterized protein LOC102449260 isoform X2 [Pelodiscus sinensis]|eukprot:XP_014424813.1 uncharacterized protein LOC102449260 isoform X2 [Pelodiscus sinensis]
MAAGILMWPKSQKPNQRFHLKSTLFWGGFFAQQLFPLCPPLFCLFVLGDGGFWLCSVNRTYGTSQQLLASAVSPDSPQDKGEENEAPEERNFIPFTLPGAERAGGRSHCRCPRVPQLRRSSGLFTDRSQMQGVCSDLSISSALGRSLRRCSLKRCHLHGLGIWPKWPMAAPGLILLICADSPDSFDNEEDYDDVSMSEVGEQMLQRHPAHAQNTDATSPEGTGVYVLAGKPASLSPPRTADPLPDSNHGKGHRAKSIMTLYVLMGICFAMWAVLLSVAVVKLLQALADARTEREEIQSNMNKSYKELWDIAESICSALPEPLRCHAGWKKFEKACYFFSNMTGDWTWAKQFCVDQKSHLVSVNTDEEQAFLKEHSESDKTYWLGLSDAMEEGRWQWVDQSTYSTSFWYIEGPDSKREEEDCASMRPSGMWDDSNCSQPNYWICEKKWIC